MIYENFNMWGSRFVFFMIFSLTTIPVIAGVKTVKNIHYAANADKANTLNIYYDDSPDLQKPVLVFIHGGSWSSGKKETYWWLGRNFAKKGVTTVIINYPLAPVAGYDEMATDCALAVKWVYEHINGYQGDREKIFLMGHSAGGHLAELINANPVYFKKAGMENPVKGMILNDAFGLDMYEYLTVAEKDHYYLDFIRTFSEKNENWKLGSPLTYAANIFNPHLIFYGGDTYDAIKLQSPRLNELLKNNGIKSSIEEIPGKKHVPMITQFIWGSSRMYPKIIDFIKNNF